MDPFAWHFHVAYTRNAVYVNNVDTRVIYVYPING